MGILAFRATCPASIRIRIQIQIGTLHDGRQIALEEVLTLLLRQFRFDRLHWLTRYRV